MFCWGKIAEGQPGLGETEDEPVLTPRDVDVSFGSLSEDKDIACGWADQTEFTHSLFRELNG